MIQKLTATFLTLSVFLFTYGQKSSTEDYIRTYRPIAIKEMQRTGVPAAIKLAQGILESQSGQSDLVMRSNNHFGIKCKTGYTGPYVLHDDDAPKERFMKYESPEQSFLDHSDFLRTRSRYAFLFDLNPEDYKAWAHGLKKAGYATNPRYPQLLINIIERHNLQNYTLIALGKAESPDDLKESIIAAIETKIPEPQYPTGDFKINGTRVVFIKKGTSLFDIASQYGTTVQRIFACNDFRSNTTVAPQDQLVYLQLKRTVGENEFHEVREGECIYAIAQQTGVRLESLLKYNNLTKFASPAIGSKLYLQDAGRVALNQGTATGSQL